MMIQRPLKAFEDHAQDLGVDGFCVLMHLFRKLDYKNYIAISQADMAREMNMHRQHVHRAIKRLITLGTLIERPKWGQNRTYDKTEPEPASQFVEPINTYFLTQAGLQWVFSKPTQSVPRVVRQQSQDCCDQYFASLDRYLVETKKIDCLWSDSSLSFPMVVSPNILLPSAEKWRRISRISIQRGKYSILALVASTILFGVQAEAAVLPATPPSIQVKAGPLGKVSIGGLFSVNGRAQGNRFDASGPAGKSFSASVTDALVSVARTHGLIQFYLEAGAYNLYGIGQPPSSIGDIVSNTFGALPLAYLQITPSQNFNIQIGKLPAIFGITPLTDLISNSYNVQFGLDGWQQQTISRGIQFNYSAGPFSASLAWTDGYYSKRFNWAEGQLSYSLTSTSSITAQAGGNLGHSTFAGPLDNSDFYLLGYNYNSKTWNLFAYLQYQKLLGAKYFGNHNDGDMYGASIDVNYRFFHRFSLSTRLDYMAYSDTPAFGFGNNRTTQVGYGMGYGPGSRAAALTFTPIYRWQHFFVEGDLSYVHVFHLTPGEGFGQQGNQPNQFVAMLNAGFLL